MSLIDLVRKNSSLIYVDAESEQERTVDQFVFDDTRLKSKRKLVFLYLDNSLESLSVLWGFMGSEHTLALLAPQVRAEYKVNLEKAYSPYYIYDPARKIIEGYRSQSITHNLDIFEANDELDYPVHSTIKILLSTSGTTGSPKFVKLSEENLIQNAMSILDYLPIAHSDVVPLNLPVYYSYGLSVLTSNSIGGGKVVCTTKDLVMKEFWYDVEKYKYSSLAGVPFVYEMLNRLGFPKRKNSSFRYLTQAGGKLNEKTLKIFAEYCQQEHILFYVMYGQTEATARMSYLHPDDLNAKLGSIGKPIKNGKFIIDKDSSELCYQGPNVFGGYATSFKDLETYRADELLHTGDLATMDEQGFYYITGRLKRFVKIMGVRINLDEIETLLKNTFEGITFVCLGLDDKKIFIGFNSSSLQDKTVMNFITSELKLHPSTITVVYMAEIPLTSNGKPDYTNIYEKYKP